MNELLEDIDYEYSSAEELIIKEMDGRWISKEGEDVTQYSKK
ncbi:MAG: hypothetical protein SVV03_02050 [Candidatus Nanohaloarchaea archaeon]|nr:hypothetical protein [Candidatus Nanohaloarchaea archaeon]